MPKRSRQLGRHGEGNEDEKSLSESTSASADAQLDNVPNEVPAIRESLQADAPRVASRPQPGEIESSESDLTRKEYNRQNAVRARKRHKDYVAGLKKQLDEVTRRLQEEERKTDVLNAQLDVLKEQNRALIRQRATSETTAVQNQPHQPQQAMLPSSPQPQNLLLQQLLQQQHQGQAPAAPALTQQQLIMLQQLLMLSQSQGGQPAASPGGSSSGAGGCNPS